MPHIMSNYANKMAHRLFLIMLRTARARKLQILKNYKTHFHLPAHFKHANNFNNHRATFSTKTKIVSI